MKYRKDSKRRMFNAIPIMTTRGCPYECDFCCVSSIYGKKIRHVPIVNVVRDIEEADGNFHIFLDDNIIGDPRYAKDLFKAIKPLKIKWAGQASISFVHDAKLVLETRGRKRLRRSFFGLESVSTVQLKKMRKSIKEIERMGKAVKRIKDGIHFHASFVFGFDDDDASIFPDTLEFLEKHSIGSASCNVLTPLSRHPRV